VSPPFSAKPLLCDSHNMSESCDRLSEADELGETPSFEDTSGCWNRLGTMWKAFITIAMSTSKEN